MPGTCWNPEHNCSANPLITYCAMSEGFMILVESWFNSLLPWVTRVVPSASLTKRKNTPPLPSPPVDLSILLLRQLDQCHGNLDWFDVGRRGVCGRRPPHLTLSGTRCLGQVLVLSQVELLSEHGHIKDSHRRTLKWEEIVWIQRPRPECWAIPINKQSFN